MKKYLVMGILFFISTAACSRTLQTPHFVISVTCQGANYEVGCARVLYQGTNKNTGQSIRIYGKQLMLMCADGVTPCHSLGYEFNNQNTRYFISESGQLIVSQGKRIIVKEMGVWHD
jgi:hypothetical protein